MGMSYLEATSVQIGTVVDYQSRLQSFVDWCRRNHKNWVEECQLDEAVVTYFDEMFWKGLPGEDGSKLLAALKFILSDLSRAGKLAMPRAHRALKSWLA